MCFNFSDVVGVGIYSSTPSGRGCEKKLLLRDFCLHRSPVHLYSACSVRYCDVDFEITEIIVVYKIVSKCLENNSRTNSTWHIYVRICSDCNIIARYYTSTSFCFASLIPQISSFVQKSDKNLHDFFTKAQC